MSYYSAFKINDTSGIKIPANFLQNLINKPNERLKHLETLTEDVMTVKELREMEELRVQDNSREISLLGEFRVTNRKYDYRNESKDGYLMYYNDRAKRLEFPTWEGEIFALTLQGDYFVGSRELYGKSNYDSLKDIIEDMLREYKSDAIIEDMGDEEYGFVDGDGCDRVLSAPIVYKAGKRV